MKKRSFLIRGLRRIRHGVARIITHSGWAGYTPAGSSSLATGQSAAAGRLVHYIGQAHVGARERPRAAPTGGSDAGASFLVRPGWRHASEARQPT